MQQITLPFDNSTDEKTEHPDFQVCPKCGHETPQGVVICWWCGYCMDAHIRELAEAVS